MHRSHLLVQRHPSPEERQQIQQQMFEERQHLYRQAVDHVERVVDAAVVESLARYARLNEAGDNRIAIAVRSQLGVLFGRRLNSEAALADFNRIVDTVLAGAPGDVCLPANVAPAPPPGWPGWLARYRGCLDALRGPFGLPGECFLVNGGEVMQQPGERVLGQRPNAE